MEYELDIEKIPDEDRQKILKAIEDFKKGKKRAKRKLYKYVKQKRLNRYFYKELVEKYGSKKDYVINNEFIWECFAILMIFLFFGSICILVNSIIVRWSVWVVISLVSLILCLLNFYIIKIDYKQDLHHKVTWIAQKENSRRCNSLINYIWVEQEAQNLPEQYRINFLNEEEKEYLSSILNTHKEYVIKQYLHNNLRITTNLYRLKDLEYYFFSLYNFIDDKLTKDDFYENHREYVSEHWYTQKLTDYGKVYYKLLLIIKLYIEANENVRKLYNYLGNPTEYIMEIIENNEEKFYK
jgi:hypothetical protein